MVDEIAIDVPSLGIQVTQYVKSYRLESDFLSPSDHLTFEVWAERSKRAELLDRLLLPKRDVVFSINGTPQFVGNIDRRTIGGDGTIQIQASDYLSQIVDGDADVRVRILKGQKLQTAALSLLGPAGITAIEDSGNNGVREALSGGLTFDKAPEVDSKDLTVSDYKPSTGDTIRTAVKRLLDRHGLLMAPSLSRDRIVFAAPEYRQGPSFFVNRSEEPGRLNNTVDASVTEDWTNVITGVRASGVAGTGAETRTANNIDQAVFGDGAIHPIGRSDRGKRVAFGPNGNKPIFFNGITEKGATTSTSVIYIPRFLKDNTSKTQGELERYVKKQISESLLDTLRCEYTFNGLTQNGLIYTPDTIFQVNDEVARVFEYLWCKSRVFEQSEGSDQMTRVELTLPDAYVL